MISRAPSRAMSSITSPSSRSPPNRASISARIFSVGDTRTDTGVVLPSVSLVALEGTYVRCHLHQRRDTTHQLVVPPVHQRDGRAEGGSRGDGPAEQAGREELDG